MGEIVKFDFLVDSSQFSNSLAKMQTDINSCRQSILQGFNSIVFDSFLNNLASVKNAFLGIVGVVASFLNEAEKIEDVGTRLGVMLGGDASSGEKLAHSLERLATNGVVPLQELEQAAVALTGRFASTSEISEWVGVFADISAGSKLAASRLAEMVARLDDMGKAEFTELANAGIPIYTALSKVLGVTTSEVVKLAAAGKVSGDDFLAALRLMTQEGEKFYELNASMSNTTAGSWATLAASWTEIMAEVGHTINDWLRPKLQSVSKILQEYKSVFVNLISFTVKFAGLLSGLGAAKLAVTLGRCLVTMVAMKTTAEKIKSAALALNKVGVVALLAAGWQIGSFLADRFSGADEDAEKAEKERQEAMRQKEQQAQMDAAAQRLSDAQDAAHEAETRLNNLEEKLKSTSSEKEFADAAKELAEEMKKLAKAYDEDARVGDSDANHLRYVSWKRASSLYDELDQLEAQRKARAAQEEKEKASAELLDRMLDLKAGAQRHDFEENWEKLTSKDRRLVLRALLWGEGYRGGDSVNDLEAGYLAAMEKAQKSGDRTKFDWLQSMYGYIPGVRDLEKQEAETHTANLRGLREIRDRELLLTAKESGDESAVARLTGIRAAEALAAELVGYGLEPDVAKARAANIVAREMGLEGKKSESRREFVADSLAVIGGGGRGFSLGEAQMELSRKKLAVAEQSRDLLVEISKRMQSTLTIPVVP